MRFDSCVRLRPLAALLLVGCASAAYARAGGEAGGEASITAEPVSLAVRVVEPRAVFSSEQTIFLENGGDGHAMRFTGSSRIEVRPDAPRPAHAFWLRRYSPCASTARTRRCAEISSASRTSACAWSSTASAASSRART